MFDTFSYRCCRSDFGWTCTAVLLVCHIAFFLFFLLFSRLFLFFFFSSRRRHTRCLSDWSSDVCSSDLSAAGRAASPRAHRGCWQPVRDCRRVRRRAPVAAAAGRGRLPSSRGPWAWPRSEERRVGKECRYQGRLDHQTKNTEKGTTRQTD